MKVSVIDLGFNSAKLVNYYVDYNNSYKAYQREGAKVRLGQGLAQTGVLAQESIKRTIDILRLFRDIVDLQSIKHVVPVATSAVREATNGTEFLEQVFHETGFRFRVLSGKEEGLCSYLGALQSTCIPTALFFDIGGGSLELVYSENFKIKNFMSLPLGGLRLSQTFSDSDGVFSKKNYSKMEEHVLEVLPDRRGLEISFDAVLVGAGGTLRAIAMYDQESLTYPLDKIHNYRIDIERIISINRMFRKMTSSEIAKIDAFGSNRADTITAGSCVIRQLMKKLEFEKVTVSAHGLREGALSVYLSSSKKNFSLQQIDQNHFEDHVKECCKSEIVTEYMYLLVKPLLSSGLLKKREYEILIHALKQIKILPPLTNLNNLFYVILDGDKPGLSHREQLVLALSIVQTKKLKTAAWLFTKYRSIIQAQDKKSIQKIAALLSISEILEKVKMKVRFIKGRRREILLTLLPSKNILPIRLIENALKMLQEAFGIIVSYSLFSSPMDTGLKTEIITVARRKKKMITTQIFK
jgi:exopolyphosphatase/guanosine-5'-triphosphate,3'-diphosphate pyrophosphatase